MSLACFRYLACIMIFLITDYEFSFDRDHPEGDRIYRSYLMWNCVHQDGASQFADVLGGGLRTRCRI